MKRSLESMKRAAVVGVETIPPRLRQRPISSPAQFIAFKRGRGSPPEVYVRRQVLVDIAAHAQATLPNESIGLLYGRVWQDSAGAWIVLNHFAAPNGGAELTPGQCTLTPVGSAALQQQADNLYLAEEYTGSWAHSHVSEEPCFSPPDFAHQAKKSIEAVGLLAYPRPNQRDWAFALYLGPSAIELWSDTAVSISLTEIHSQKRKLPAPELELPLSALVERQSDSTEDQRPDKSFKPRFGNHETAVELPRFVARPDDQRARPRSSPMARTLVVAIFLLRIALLLLVVLVLLLVDVRPSSVAAQIVAGSVVALVIVISGILLFHRRPGARNRRMNVITDPVMLRLIEVERRLAEVENQQAGVALRSRYSRSDWRDARRPDPDTIEQSSIGNSTR